MFCHKCGTRTLDGAEFCQKCGAKLIADTPVEQSKSAPPASPPQRPNLPLMNISGKKKSKLPIILGIAAGIAIVLIALAAIGNKEGPDADAIADNSDVPSEFGTQSAEVPGSTTTDRLLFQGTPIQDIMGAHSSDIIAIFGEPKTQSEDSIEYGVEFTEEGWMCFCLDNADQVNVISADPLHFAFNGQSLAQNFDALVAILGDDYTDMGGTAYSWQAFWNYGDCQIYFTFPKDSDDDKPHSIDIMISDSTAPADDDDYSWVEGDIDDSLLRDQALVGRWRAYDGGSVEFDEYGNAVVSFTAYPDAEQKPYALAWTANNGQLTLISYFSLTERWTISENTLRLTLPNGGYSTYSRDEESESLLGTWNCLGNSIRKYSKAHVGALVLLPDGTGEVERVFSNLEFVMQPVTWWADDTNLYTSWSQQLTYDYSVSGDMLTIYFSNGSQIYTKVGN